MRPFEILLTIANVLALGALAIPGSSEKMQTLRYTCFFALIAAIIQMLAEGSRWQMMPAYFLSFAVSTTSTLQLILPPVNLNRSFVKRLADGMLKGIGIFILTIAVTLPIVFPVFRLATPAGPYEIGTLTYHWIDASRREIFNTDPAERRQLVAQIWYPVKGDASPERAPYVDDAGSLSRGLSRTLASNGLIRLPEFFFTHFAYVTTHAIPAAHVASDKVSFPVLIYATGLDGFRQVNMFQIEHLVSNGYIVVGLDQPYTAASTTLADGQIIQGLTKASIQPLIDQSITPSDDVPRLNGYRFENGIIPYLAADVIFTRNKLEALNTSDPQGILIGHFDMERMDSSVFRLAQWLSAKPAIRIYGSTLA